MSEERIVVNHESIKQAVNTLFTAKVFQGVKASGVKTRKGGKWTARMLLTVALFWAWSKADGLKERFQQARKLVVKIFRWPPPPGETYNGFMKQLRKWHFELQVLCVGELRTRIAAAGLARGVGRPREAADVSDHQRAEHETPKRPANRANLQGEMGSGSFL